MLRLHGQADHRDQRAKTAVTHQSPVEALGPIDTLLCFGDIIYEYRFSSAVIGWLRELDVLTIPGNWGRRDTTKDPTRDLVLQREYVLEITLEAVRPQVRAACSLDELAVMRTRLPALRTLPSSTYRTPGSRPTSSDFLL